MVVGGCLTTELVKGVEEEVLPYNDGRQRAGEGGQGAGLSRGHPHQAGARHQGAQDGGDPLSSQPGAHQAPHLS